MRLLIFDTIFPVGHRALNTRLLSYIENFASTAVINRKGFIGEKDNGKQIKFIYPKIVDLDGKGMLKTQINLFRNFFSCLRSIKVKKFDAILFFTFDTINFAFEYPFLHRKPIYLIHHRNTAELQNKTKARIFKTYCNKVHHIVFAKFIADFLINEMGVANELVHILPHPTLIPPDEHQSPDLEGDKKIFIAIAYSNDEDLISKIIAHENETRLLELNNIKLIIRSERSISQSKSIEIIRGHLSDNEYTQLYKNATGIILPYPEWYRYRFSGAIMDSIILKKKVFGSDIPVFREFEKEYPSFCSHFFSVEELFRRLIEYDSSSSETAEKEYNKFIKKHSDDNICEKLKHILIQ